MADFTRGLSELCQAVDAQSALLMLADGDGALQPMATIGRPPGSDGQAADPLSRLIRRSGDSEHRLLVPVPDVNGGLIVLERVGRDDFSQQDLALARVYARQFAGQIVAGASATATAWTRQLEAVQRIGAQLTRLTSIEAVGAALATEIHQLLDCTEVDVFISDEYSTADGQLVVRLLATSGAPVDAGGQLVPLPVDGVAGQAIARALGSGIPAGVPQFIAVGIERPGTWSMLAVPMLGDGEIPGVICLLAPAPRRFDDDAVRLVQALSYQAVVAIDNARLIGARDTLVEDLAALLDMSQATSLAQDELSLAQGLAAKMRAASRMDACIISRWQSDTTLLASLAVDGIVDAGGITDIADFPTTWSVLRTGQPCVIQTAAADDAVAEARALAEMGGQTLLMLPLAVGGRTIGLIELISLSHGRQFTAEEMNVYQTMASTAAAGLENARLLEQLRQAADIDQLTGAHNHRYLQDRLRQEVARAARNHSPLSVLMLDLDEFKPINDRFGHADGDRVLRNVAGTLRSAVRASDIVARYGGDEFVIVMPDTSADRAQEVARRVIMGIRERRHELTDGSLARVGVSAGLAVYPDNGRTAPELLQAADGAMYAAKRSRRGADLPIDADPPPPLPAENLMPSPPREPALRSLPTLANLPPLPQMMPAPGIG
jgi:diguanylate cyclase (GGDEF)-like protein